MPSLQDMRKVFCSLVLSLGCFFSWVGYVHKVPVAQELSSISHICMVKEGSTAGEATAKGNWEIAVYVMEESKLMDKSTAIRRKPCLPSKVLGEEECLT